MVSREREQLQMPQEDESLGLMIEKGVAEFLDSGNFKCVRKIEQTKNHGKNDNKGIDIVVEFTNGKKLAVDITTREEKDPKFLAKWGSMVRSPLTSVNEERDDNGNIVLEQINDSIPKALIRVDSRVWEEYMGYEKPEYVPDMLRAKIEQEKESIVSQIIKQIDFLLKDLKGIKEYQKKAKPIKKVLESELQEDTEH